MSEKSLNFERWWIFTQRMISSLFLNIKQIKKIQQFTEWYEIQNGSKWYEMVFVWSHMMLKFDPTVRVPLTSQVRFMVDGERIAADDTAEKLGLEEFWFKFQQLSINNTQHSRKKNRWNCSFFFIFLKKKKKKKHVATLECRINKWYSKRCSWIFCSINERASSFFSSLISTSSSTKKKGFLISGFSVSWSPT